MLSSQWNKANKILLGVIVILVVINSIILGVYLFQSGYVSLPTTQAVIDKSKETITVWSTRISDHDPRALGMMSPTAKLNVFSTIQPTQLNKIFSLKLKTTIIEISNVRENSNGQITARVYYKGLHTLNGYYSADFLLSDSGSKYFVIEKVKPVNVVLPKSENVTKMSMTFTQENSLDIPKGVVNIDRFLEISLKNNAKKVRIFALVSHGLDATKIENINALVILQPGKSEDVVLMDLPKGEYDVYEGTQPVAKLGSLTFN